MNEKISIIVPIYNEEKYVKQCLESLINQDFDEYEIICIDDHSTDNSNQIVREFQKISNRIKLILHSSNQGLSSARNTGLKAAHGEYVLFVDSDDMLLDNALKIIYKNMQENELDILSFDYKQIVEKNVYAPHYKKCAVLGEVCSGRESFCKHVELNDTRVMVWLRCYKRKFLMDNDIWFCKGIYFEDNLFYFCTQMSAVRTREIENILYVYRRHIKSITMGYSNSNCISMLTVIVNVFGMWNIINCSVRESTAIKKYLDDLIYSFLEKEGKSNGCNDLPIGTDAIKYLYNILHNGMKMCADIDEAMICEIKKYNDIYVYGAKCIMVA